MANKKRTLDANAQSPKKGGRIRSDKTNSNSTKTRSKSNGHSTGHSTSQRVGKGSARQRYQQYLALAEAAEKSGDHVSSQSYYQHADHYYRVLNAAPAG